MTRHRQACLVCGVAGNLGNLQGHEIATSPTMLSRGAQPGGHFNEFVQDLLFRYHVRLWFHGNAQSVSKTRGSVSKKHMQEKGPESTSSVCNGTAQN